jgi:hypothetical protein
LLGILSPALRLPRYELLAAGAVLQSPVLVDTLNASTNYWIQRCRVDARFYLIAPKGETITLDPGACEAVVEVPGLLAPTHIEVNAPKAIASPNVSIAGNTCIFTDIAQIILHAEGNVPSIGNAHAEELRLALKLRPIGYERGVVISGTLGPQKEINPAAGLTHSFVLNKAKAEAPANSAGGWVQL